MFSNVAGKRHLPPDVECIYELPLVLHARGSTSSSSELLNIWSRAPQLERWEAIVEKV